MAQKKRQAFTLVELLVVITIIGGLMGILLPAVNAALKAVRNGSCRAQIQQVANAANVFEERERKYPGYLNGHAKDEQTGNYTIDVGWVVKLFDGLDRPDLAAQWAVPRGTRSNPYMEILVCPEDPPEQAPNADQTYCSYVANGGAAGIDQSSERAANGIFHNAGMNMGRKAPATTRAFITGSDGLGYTLLFSENVAAADMDNGGWHRWNGANADIVKRYTTFVWQNVSGTNVSSELHINGKPSGVPNLDQVRLGSYTTANRPSSFHAGGVNVAFADGRATFVKEEMDYYVYIHLMTPDGKSATTTALSQEEKAYILDPNDYE